MSDRDKLQNLKIMLSTLIDTCNGEIAVTDKLLAKAKSNIEKSKLQKEKAFWQGKLEVAKYAKLFAE